MPIDTTNKFLAAQVVGAPPRLTICNRTALVHPIPADDALLLAAWLVALAEPAASVRFADVLDEVRNC